MKDSVGNFRNRVSLMLTGNTLSEKQIVCGRELVLRRGSYRSKPDYDDAWLLACASRAKVALDIGCNIGQSAVIMLLANTLHRIVLVDPNPRALVIASENLIRNQLARSSTYVCAFVGEASNATREFWTVGAGAAGSMYASHAETASKRDLHYKVNTITLDALCSDLSIEPDLIKVDVEGAESNVLAGAEQYASNHGTRFFIEMHSNPDLSMTQNAELILAWCSRVGYFAWYLSEHERLTSTNQIAHRGRCHLLVQPSDWEYPTWLRSLHQSDRLETAYAYSPRN